MDAKKKLKKQMDSWKNEIDFLYNIWTKYLQTYSDGYQKPQGTAKLTEHLSH